MSYEFGSQMSFECQMSMGVKWGSVTYGSGCQMSLSVKWGSVNFGTNHPLYATAVVAP